MSDRIVRTGDVKLYSESFGDPSDPPILLIMGVMASMLWWPDRFCADLAANGRYVIRYDNRDTGLSTHWPQGQPGYSFADMADDAVAVMDGYGLASAHVVGMSMGGMIAQRTALRHPERVRTLTIISSSPLGVDGLPPSAPDYQAHSAEGEKIDWTDLDAVAGYIRKDCAMLAGSRHPHDPEAAADLVARDMARASNFLSMTNHFMLFGEDESRPEAKDIRAPLLAIHGTSDPLFPVRHGEAFAEVVPGAHLHRIEGGGHEIHDADIGEFVRAIVGHTRKN